ncbi:MAG: AAA family ATPase [Mycoplasmataceae bacterium]|nr:AAA family ATPase [Mycoplasmataceae bacterium]
MNNISVEEIWNKFEEKFNIDEEIDFFTLSSLLRVIVEKEKLKKKIEDLHYSIIHKFLHWESIRSDKPAFLISIINILEKLPDKYNCEYIKKQIIENIPEEYDFFKIYDYGDMVKKPYKLIIKNFCFFSYQEKIFFYTGKIADKNNGKTITFISKNKFALRDIYYFNFQYVTINYNATIFMEVYSENFSDTIRKSIFHKYSIQNYDELLLLLNFKTWPLEIDKINEREILIDIHKFTLGTFESKTNEKILPFLKNPYIAKISLKRKKIDEIIFSYNVSDKTIMKNNQKTWEMESELLREMIENNSYFLDVDKSIYEKFSFSWLSFFKKSRIKNEEKNKEIFLISFKSEEEKYEIFKNLFINNEENNLSSKRVDVISSQDIHNWNWIGEENGKTPKKILKLLEVQQKIILLGPAGHGKTFSLIEIIDFYLSKFLIVKLICPTWKAIGLYNDKIQSSTVEKRNKNLYDDFFDDVDLLIIDEISLIGEWTFLSKIKNHTQIIFSGDTNQLGPVNKKTKFRQHEWLFENATKEKIIDLKNDKNYRISNLPDNHSGKHILKKILEGNFDFKKNVKNVNFFYSIEETVLKLKELSMNNYTIITQFNGGIWGVDFLNRLLRNGYSEEFRKGDKIIFIKTEVNFSNIDNREKAEYYIGLSGEVIDIEISTSISNEKKYIIKDDHDKIITIKSIDEKISNIIEHSYVMTAHMAQGSTIKNVVVLSPSAVDYDWLYTAVSRFSENIEIIFVAGGSEYIKFNKKIKTSIV